MKLTVLSIAYPFASVSQRSVGGSEHILLALDSALTAAGHTSLVVACQGSTPGGKLFSAPLPAGMLDEANRQWARVQFQIAINRALSSRCVDLIHMHGLNFYEYNLPRNIPVLVTLHMPFDWYPRGIWKRFGPNVTFQCVSENQRNTCLRELGKLAVIPNGVDLPRMPQAAPKSDYAIVLGRICPEKNQHAALQAGTLARTPVLLGGQVFPYSAHVRYFDECIEPLLGKRRAGPRHDFLGILDRERQFELLRNAKCLLHPTLAPETSSLVAMEAFAAGTPVIAYRSGALPEIIEDGKTGFLVNTPEEMAVAMGRVGTLSRAACRLAAEQRFSKTKMIERYFGLYGTLARPAQHARRYA